MMRALSCSIRPVQNKRNSPSRPRGNSSVASSVRSNARFCPDACQERKISPVKRKSTPHPRKESMSDYGPLFAGLDPGASGGLGLLSADGQFEAAYPWPGTEREVYDLLAEYAPFLRHACLEVASSRPGQGVATTFAFGRAYGLLRGFLIALAIPFEEAGPSRWTRGFGVH